MLHITMVIVSIVSSCFYGVHISNQDLCHFFVVVYFHVPDVKKFGNI